MQRGLRGSWRSGASMGCVAPLPGDKSVVLAEQSCGGDREDLLPVLTVYQLGQGGESAPVHGPVADATCRLRRRTAFLWRSRRSLGFFAASPCGREGARCPGGPSVVVGGRCGIG